MNANYRKHNDRSLNSSTYHKKDGTNIRAILKREDTTMKEEDLEDLGRPCVKCNDFHNGEYGLCDKCQKAPCRHGNREGECQECYYEWDQAYDAQKGS